LASYASGHLSGQPAITRRSAPGGGSATYVSTHLNRKDLTALSKKLLETFGVHSELPEDLRERVELTVRTGEAAEYWFLTNRTEESVSLAGLAGEPLTGLSKTGEHTLPARGTVVLRVPSGS